MITTLLSWDTLHGDIWHVASKTIFFRFWDEVDHDWTKFFFAFDLISFCVDFYSQTPDSSLSLWILRGGREIELHNYLISTKIN
jgi:hypothetical protein